MHLWSVSRRDRCALGGKLSSGNKSALLAVFAAASIAIVAAHPGSALAACAVTAGPNTVTCNSTVTTNTVNTNAASASSTDRTQAFSTGSVSATINAGQTVSGYGLAIAASGGDVNVVNNGALTTNQPASALAVSTSAGSITYSGNGSANNLAGNSPGLTFLASGSITIGTSGTPVTPNFQGSTAIVASASNAINLALNGGSLTTLWPGGAARCSAAVTCPWHGPATAPSSTRAAPPPTEASTSSGPEP